MQAGGICPMSGQQELGRTKGRQGAPALRLHWNASLPSMSAGYPGAQRSFVSDAEWTFTNPRGSHPVLTALRQRIPQAATGARFPPGGGVRQRRISTGSGPAASMVIMLMAGSACSHWPAPRWIRLCGE